MAEYDIEKDLTQAVPDTAEQERQALARQVRQLTREKEQLAGQLDEALRKRVEGMFFDQLRDTAKLRLQQPDGTYRSIRQNSPGLFNSQEAFAGRASASAPREEDSGKAPSGGVIAWLKKLFSKG